MTKLIDTAKINKLARELNKRTKELIELSETKIITKIDSEIAEIETMVGGRYIVYIKQSDYNLLTEEERLDETKYYIITDAEDLSHEHANKDFLDSLEEGNIDASSLNGYKIWVGTMEELNNVVNKDPKTIYYVTDSVDEIGNIESLLVNLETEINLLKEHFPQTLVQNNVINGEVSLTENPYQIVTFESDTTVRLPYTETFTKIHLYCNALDNVSIWFPGCKWNVEGNDAIQYDSEDENLIIGLNTEESGVIDMDAYKSYEIIAVYNTVEWLVKCIVYS